MISPYFTCGKCGKPFAIQNGLFSAPTSYYCQCPISYTPTTTTTTTTNSTTPGLTQCPRCRWYVSLFLHTQADCHRLRGISAISSGGAACSSGAKEKVPQAFYDAFAEAEQELRP